MPRAGEEGYEDLCMCPYDKSHEIRRGKMQFHLEKCRKNHKIDELIQCPFNKTHIVPRVEQQFHTEEECKSRANWDRTYTQVGEDNCPVKNLVPVNAATVPDGEACWDNYEVQGSVLAAIKEEAPKKKIFRMMQCEPKSKRKMFREEERMRHSELENVTSYPRCSHTPDNVPLQKPTTAISKLPINRQDPSEAIAAITRQFSGVNTNVASDDLNAKEMAPSPIKQVDTASSVDVPAPSMPGRSRPSTASNIAKSASKLCGGRDDEQDHTFSSAVPIPGLGRGRNLNFPKL